jgi:hypothetical protein
MPLVRALTSWSGHRVGDEFEVSDTEARILTALDLPGGPKAVIVDIDEPIDLPKGFYRRRDMRARK